MIHLDAVSKEGKPRPSQRWEETTRMVRGRADLGEAAGVEDGCFCRRLKNEDFSVGTEAAWYGRWRWQVCMYGGREACGPNHDKDNMLDWPIMLPRGPSAVPIPRHSIILVYQRWRMLPHKALGAVRWTRPTGWVFFFFAQAVAHLVSIHSVSHQCFTG